MMDELKNFMARNELSYRKFALQVDISITALAYILNGKRMPSLEMAYRIADATLGIVSVDSWRSMRKKKENTKQTQAKRKKNK